MTNADRQGKTKRPADAPERELESMQRQSEQVGERIDETRRDWENKRGDGTVAPGARPQAGADEDASPSALSDQNYEETHPQVAGEGTEAPEDHRQRAGADSSRESKGRPE
jgi:hypothetical protein